MPLIDSPSKEAFRSNVSEMVRSGRPRDQALAAAYRNARDHGAKWAKRAKGGGLGAAGIGALPGLAPADIGKLADLAALTLPETPSIDRGLIHSDVPGRTDRLNVKVKPNSYVIPADVVSGLGQGNSMAGAGILNEILEGSVAGGTMPDRTKVSQRSPKQRMVRTGKRRLHKRDEGGLAPREPEPETADDETDILAAGGEFIVPPETVIALGGGDPKKGHDLLDKMVKNVRRQVIDHMKKLPAPVKE